MTDSITHVIILSMLLATCQGRRHVYSGISSQGNNGLPSRHAACTDAIPKLIHQQSWKSSRPRCSSDITLVTHLSSSQLVSLSHLCVTWKGWIAAAVHLSADAEHAPVLSDLSQWHADLDKVDACALDLSVFSSKDGSQIEAAVPANSLCNRALAMSTTEMVMPIDMDFLVNYHLRGTDSVQQLLRWAAAGAASVIPAWQLSANSAAGQQLATTLVTGSKAQLIEAAQNRAVTSWQDGSKPDPQSASRLDYWLHSDAWYGAEFEAGYAPLVVVPKKAVPWFDERIHDGNLGRQMHLQHMHALGLGFVVHPDAFVVKQPAVSSTVQQDGRLLQQAVVSSTVQQDSGQLQQAGLDSARGFNSEHLWQSDADLTNKIHQQLLQGTYKPAAYYTPCSDQDVSPVDVSPNVLQECSEAETQEKKPSISPLWGVHGELFNAVGQLRDWSRAGYRAGEAPIPRNPAFSDLIVNWSAAGDGVTDDTQALKQAIELTPEGSVLYLPEGKYSITEMINITKSIILRGAGPTQTTLYFRFSLTDVYGNTPDPVTGYSQWAFRPGFVNFLGTDPIEPSTLLARVVKGAAKGDRELSHDGWVKQGLHLRVGDWVRLVQSDPDTDNSPASQQTLSGQGWLHSHSLIEHLYGGWEVMSPDAPPHVHAGELQGTQYAAQLIAKLISFDADTVTLDRKLPFDVQTHWQPEIHTLQPSLREAGIEDVTIEFGEAQYGGHFKEAGYNALYIGAAHDCWVRNLHIINADYAVGLNGTHFCTLDNLSIYDSFDRGGGHHGIDVSYGADNLIKDFSIYKQFLHDISIEWYTHGNVFVNGSGLDLNLDHHRGAPFGNLFTNLDLGKGTRPFASSGAHGRGAHSGGYNVYWNLLSRDCWALPFDDFGHHLTFAGAVADTPCADGMQALQGLMFPFSLYDAMKTKFGRQTSVSGHARHLTRTHGQKASRHSQMAALTVQHQ